MRNIGIALFLFCVGAAACNGGGSGGKGQPTRTEPLQSCGGFIVHPQSCPEGYFCVDSSPDCPRALDCSGVCVDDPTTPTCGGMAGIACPDGLTCVYNSLDRCEPQDGGVDCGGVCLKP